MKENKNGDKRRSDNLLSWKLPDSENGSPTAGDRVVSPDQAASPNRTAPLDRTSSSDRAESSDKRVSSDQAAPSNRTAPPDREKLDTVYRLATEWAGRMEKSRISEYTELLYSPGRLIWLNVLSGTARGVGIAVGFTFFAATIIYVLQVLGALNLPIIGDYIADIVRIVQHQLELNTY